MHVSWKAGIPRKRNTSDNMQSGFAASYKPFKKASEKFFVNVTENLLTFFTVTSELFCPNIVCCTGKKYSWDSVPLANWSFWSLLYLNVKLPRPQSCLVSHCRDRISYWSVIQVFQHRRGKQKLAPVVEDAFQPPPWQSVGTVRLPMGLHWGKEMAATPCSVCPHGSVLCQVAL